MKCTALLTESTSLSTEYMPLLTDCMCKALLKFDGLQGHASLTECTAVWVDSRALLTDHTGRTLLIENKVTILCRALLPRT